MILCKAIMDTGCNSMDPQIQSARIIIKHHDGGKMIEELGDGIARICTDGGAIYVVQNVQLAKQNQSAIDVAFWLVQKVNDKVDTSKQPIVSYQLQEPERGLFLLSEISSVKMMPAQFKTLVSTTEIRDIHAALINLL
jgi:hypothetical protein